MDDSQELITVISNLTEEECNSIKATLSAHGISFIVNEHGAHSKYKSFYFEIKVERKNIDAIRPIISRHKAKASLNSQKCPKCGHLGSRKIEKISFLLKIYYWGTTLVECKRCGEKFGI